MTPMNDYNLLKYINVLKGLVSFEKTDEIKNEFLAILDQLINGNDSIELINIKEFYKLNKLVECNNELNKLRIRYINQLFTKPCKINFYDDLIITSENNVRFCNNCNKNVYRVDNKIELEKRVNLEQCIAIDVNSFELNELEKIKYKSCHSHFKEEWIIGTPFSENYSENFLDENGIL